MPRQQLRRKSGRSISEVEKTGEGKIVKYCGFEIEAAPDNDDAKKISAGNCKEGKSALESINLQIFRMRASQKIMRVQPETFGSAAGSRDFRSWLRRVRPVRGAPGALGAPGAGCAGCSALGLPGAPGALGALNWLSVREDVSAGASEHSVM